MVSDTLTRRLLDHLRAELHQPELEYVDRPEAISGGYDTQIFSFRVNAMHGAWTAPLILRLLGLQDDPRRALREGIIQNTVATLGYPAPRVLLASADPDVLGGAFLVMERVPGRAMFDERRLGIGSTLGTTQARLHALDANFLLEALDTIGARNTVTFEGLLAGFDHRIARRSLDSLRPAMAWLCTNRPPPPERVVICHGDFHPQNVLMAGGTVTGVLDWPNVVVADPAYDVASTRVILRFVPVELMAASAALRGVIRLVRPLMLQRYLTAYRRRRPIDRRALVYYEAVSCMRHLLRVAEARVGGRTMTALDASRFGERLVRRFAAITGVIPRLPTVAG